MRGLRLLIVRPEKGRDSLLTLLQGEGCVVHQCPVMTIAPLTDTQAQRQVARQITASGDNIMAVFISANAVEIGLALPGVNLPTDTVCFAVGEATAEALRARGYRPVIPESDFSSEGLLALPQLQHLSGKKLLLFKGEGGRTLLQRKLSERGADVYNCGVYRRTLSDLHRRDIQELLEKQQLDALLIHSGELLQNLLSVADQQRTVLLKLPLIAPGRRVAELAAEAGFEQVAIADSAVATDMVSALRQWYSGDKSQNLINGENTTR